MQHKFQSVNLIGRSGITWKTNWVTTSYLNKCVGHWAKWNWIVVSIQIVYHPRQQKKVERTLIIKVSIKSHVPCESKLRLISSQSNSWFTLNACFTPLKFWWCGSFFRWNSQHMGKLIKILKFLRFGNRFIQPVVWTRIMTNGSKAFL